MNQSLVEEVFQRETSLGAVDYVVIGAMFFMSSGIGLYFHFSGGKQKTTNEFLLAGQNMSIFPVALSLMASGKSAITYLGVPADMYVYGTHFAFVNLGTSAGALAAGYLFIPVFFNTKSSTTYEYLERRFGRLLRRICSLSFSLQVILYTAVCLYAPALALSAVTNLSLWTSVITVGVVCTFYCTMGGMKAVLWTDVLQALLMYVGLIAILAKGSADVGGVQTVWSRAEEGGRLIVPGLEMDFTSRYTFLNIFMYGFITSLSAYGVGQMQVQRMLTVSSVKKARIALFSSIPVIAIFHVVNVFVGLVVYANFYDCDPLTSSERPISKPDQLLPYFSLKALSSFPGMPGLCICGMLSAALSTLSSLFNSLTTVTVEDFMRPFWKMSDRRNAMAAKFITIFYGFLSLVLTYIVSSFGNVLQASTIVYGLVAGPTLGVFLLGVLTARTNEKGAVIGLLASLAFTAWISFGSAQTNIGHAKLPVSISGCPIKNSTLTSTLSPITTTLEPHMSDNLIDNIFPLFKISYMWFSPLGTLTTIVVGYFASYIFKKPLNLERHLLNPIARKLVLKEENEKKCIHLSELYSETEMLRKGENGEIVRQPDIK
ncbi:putative sodium-dependent multivitamin transporter [Argiope bruennichi]|uniref:putative sodium-dependent multivitamin transporter n=1 Tax=Argiope bruennichi TaxID=94029 RepID=UPI0024943C04|nr:putative sodium-dependent multivitamin transporter [Argiope bruennichi]